MNDVFIRQVDMPSRVKGMTVLDEDGNYNIYINDRLSHYARIETLQHEMRHVSNRDHYNFLGIREIEGEDA